MILLYGLPSCARSLQAIPAKLRFADQTRNARKIAITDTK